MKHTDRPSCEISISLCLGYEAEHAWPLLLELRSGTSSIELEPGDALFYRGIEVSHWRQPMKGERAVQVFLHYVDQTGPYAELKYDKRNGIPFAKPFRNDLSALKQTNQSVDKMELKQKSAAVKVHFESDSATAQPYTARSWRGRRMRQVVI